MSAEEASRTTVYALIAMRARVTPDAPALECGGRRLTFAQTVEAADRIAADFTARGLTRGDRIAVISENRIDYTLVQLAGAKLGLIVACQNWRLLPADLAYCVALIDPALVIASERHMALATEVAGNVPVAPINGLGASGATPCAAEPEDGLFIIYTSGTTGRPKAAVISHRAQIARMSALRLDMGILPGDGYISWAPMFHIGGTEHVMSTLMSGGPNVIVDSFDPDAVIDALETHPIGWLMLVPATIEPLIARMKERRPKIKGVRGVGCMADLVPLAVVNEITTLVNAPFVNSFGATETGMAPLSGGMIPVGKAHDSLAKQLSILTELRLVGPDGQDVAPGEAGEAWVRGPTLFSGYWNAPEVNAKEFAGGWFHMGDLFRLTARGYEFAGRSKYLIKSGGENIYPAEIERILLADPRVADAIVVKKADDRWGEVPVAVIARQDETLTEDQVNALCAAELASYKRPRGVVFVGLEDLPRNVSGKILREAVEGMV
ncbi:class I adenylate-forming enzyme family protein [Maritimibacter sp. DP1N21-5]|uniref:class I adenylate-forming enzyme family protein n=1 Tax=Maritimibacter sp. DP1N21-5 TaxID=2836867 RepID=UPI001C45ACAC|nr:AMP-binding protein [Maritimibacter sp. DP1N21-5]MBV7407444.1 AMP-binding protein [Maritimibacter sp. DP1N21-5]